MSTKKKILREKIIKETKIIYETSGIEEISLNQLLIQLGISKSTFYNVFGSKQELQYFAFLKDRIHVQEFYESIRQQSDPLQLIERVVRHVYEQLEQLSPTIITETIVDSIRKSNDERIQSIFEKNQYHIVLKDIIDMAINNNIFVEKIPLNDFMDLLFQTTLGIIMLWGHTGGRFQLTDEVCNKTLTLFRQMYLAE